MSTRRTMIPRSVQAKVVETYGNQCWLKFPGCTGRADTLDHLMPYSKGGTDSVNNLRPACRHCNSLRADRLVQGRGIEVHVLLCAPRIRPHGGMPSTATWLDYDAMLGMMAAGRGVDDDVWRIAEGMWNGAVAKALRLPSAVPLVLLPPASVAVERWRAGRGVDDDVWRIAEGMWNGAVAKALRLPSAVPLVLLPPASVAVERWREWLRLGYDMQVDSTHPAKPFRCDLELRADVSWMRSGVNDRSVGNAVRARDDDWRRCGLVF